MTSERKNVSHETLKGFLWKCHYCAKQSKTRDHTHHDEDWFYQDGDPTVIRTIEDIPELTPEFIDVLGDLAAASFGLGMRFVIDWERFYDMFESQQGYDMQDYGGSADNKIRRVARKRFKELEAEGRA